MFLGSTIDDSNMVFPAYECLGEQFAENASDIEQPVTFIICSIRKKVTVFYDKAVGWQFLYAVKHPVPSLEFLFHSRGVEDVGDIDKWLHIGIANAQSHYSVVALYILSLFLADIEDIKG